MSDLNCSISNGFDSIEDALSELRKGKIIIVVDSEGRENEGDFIMAAEKVQDSDVNFMAKYGRGIICAPITKKRAEELQLDYMVKDHNTSAFGTPFTISVDYVHGTSTGISAADRAATIRNLASSASRPEDFLRPGHIFPLIAKENGVLERDGHTEASVDLMKLAGLTPAAMICEIMNDDGTMARTEDLKILAKKFQLKIITLDALIQFRRTEQLKEWKMSVSIPFPTKYGHFDLYMFEREISKFNSSPFKEHHIVLAKNLEKGKPTLCRVHSECFSGDLFGSSRCDCGEQLDQSLKMIASHEGPSLLIYLKQEGRGIGAVNKIHAYRLQDQGLDTVEANIKLGHLPDLRDYNVAIAILNYFGIKEINLITNNPNKVEEVQMGDKVTILNRVPLEIEPTKFNLNYLLTKRDKMGHFILQNHNHNQNHLGE